MSLNIHNDRIVHLRSHAILNNKYVKLIRDFGVIAYELVGIGTETK